LVVVKNGIFHVVNTLYVEKLRTHRYKSSLLIPSIVNLNSDVILIECPDLSGIIDNKCCAVIFYETNVQVESLDLLHLRGADSIVRAHCPKLPQQRLQYLW
jgi:hypothetical protein